MSKITAVTQQVADELGRYVYMLIDPQSSVPFYVGKGQRERFAQHGKDAMLTVNEDGETEQVGLKIQKIREIRAAGHEPEIWIIRHGMKTDTEYTSVEAASIDLLSSMPVAPKPPNGTRLPEGCRAQLTNARREASRGHGIVLLEDLYAEIVAPPLTTTRPLLIVTLKPWVDKPDEIPGGHRDGYGYKSEWLTSAERVKNFQEIGKSVAAWFKFSQRTVDARGINYVVATYRGVTRALFKIIHNTWEHSGTGRERRSGFQVTPVAEGAVFDEIVGQYGHRVPNKKTGDQSAFRYWPYAQ